MPLWVRGFIITDVAAVHKSFRDVIAEAEKLASLERRAGPKVGTNGQRLVKDLSDAYDTFNANLKLLARNAALRAEKGTIEKLRTDRRRPSAGNVPPLEDLVAALPLAPIGKAQTGAVGVGNVDFLNRAVNAHNRGYRSYWRAIEYGTGQEGVPSQLGRILYGSFTQSGGSSPMAPAAQYAGGGGPHPVFIAGGVGISQIDGVRTIGMGTIGREVPAKHFIQWGADEAQIMWRRDIANMQDRA